MSDKFHKPRLGWYRALLSLSEPDLDRIIEAFIEWATSPEYMVFRKENIFTYEKEYKLVKAVKRGNDVCARAPRNRLRITVLKRVDPSRARD